MSRANPFTVIVLILGTNGQLSGFAGALDSTPSHEQAIKPGFQARYQCGNKRCWNKMSESVVNDAV